MVEWQSPRTASHGPAGQRWMGAGQGVPPLLLKPHTATGSWTQKARGRAKGWRRGQSLPWQWCRAGHAPPPGSGTSALPAGGHGGHLLPAAALLSCSYQPTQQFTAASQHGRHKGKGTSRRSHQRARLGLLLTHNLPNSLLLLHSRRLPSQQGHQMSPHPRSFRVISTSLPPEACAVHDGELSVIRTPGLAVS